MTYAQHENTLALKLLSPPPPRCAYNTHRLSVTSTGYLCKEEVLLLECSEPNGQTDGIGR